MKAPKMTRYIDTGSHLNVQILRVNNALIFIEAYKRQQWEEKFCRQNKTPQKKGINRIRNAACISYNQGENL